MGKPWSEQEWRANGYQRVSLRLDAESYEALQSLSAHLGEPMSAIVGESMQRDWEQLRKRLEKGDR